MTGVWSFATIGVFAAWLPSLLLFVFLLRVERKPATNAVFVLDCVALVTFSLALGRQFGYPPPDWLRGPIYLLVAAAMWFLLISFIVVQRNGRLREERRLRRRLAERDELAR